MKKILLLILLTFGAISCFAQKISLTPVQNKSLRSILCNVDTVLFRRGASILVTLYQISNPSGSAHMPETDEVSNKYLIAISSSDETPDQMLYSVGDFYNPKILKFLPGKKDDYLLSIEYGAYKLRKKINLDITLSKIVVVNH